jgi:ribosomal protein S18 acetylase RimI-like enzyme
VSEVIVRAATQADFDEIARLTVAAYEADGQLDGEIGYEKVLADVATRAEHGEMFVAVDANADDDADKPLGAVTFVLPGARYSELARDGEAEFRTLAVDPAAQRRGVARALVEACIDRAAALGCEALVISVRDFAAAAQGLYGKFGFVRQPERDWKPMPQVQLFAMHLKLPPVEELTI